MTTFSKWDHARGFTRLELTLVLGALLVLAGTAIPGFNTLRYRSSETEVKENLHAIQLAVERFAVDTEGAYPNYLIGGEPRASLKVDPGSDDPFSKVQEAPRPERIADPLLRRGYFDAYPRNPFTRDRLAVHQLQKHLPTSFTGDDPLRNASADGLALGTRFGAQCDLMGSVLADPRFSSFVYDDKAGKTWSSYSWADIEYPAWDMWQDGRKVKEYLPGMFMYKATGPIIAAGEEVGDKLILPTEMDQYILGSYGGPNTQGKDILGSSRALVYSNGGNQKGTAELWPGTDSTTGQDVEGSPFASLSGYDGVHQTAYGNPNGLQDGIILVVTAGEDYIGDK
jgi:type II secretory pathway pseudopilin PulG